MNSNLHNLIRYFSDKGTVMLLESQSNEHPWSQKSFLAALPDAEIKARDSRITICEGTEEEQSSGNPWKALQAFRKKKDHWLFGYLGYDLKNHLESLESKNPDPVGAPDLHFMVPGFLLEYDHQTKESRLLIGEMPEVRGLSDISSVSPFFIEGLDYATKKKEYILIIREAQRRIGEGDFYEINLSHQLKGTFYGDSFALYNSMKEVGPVPFGAYLNTGDLSICCQSPERFLCKDGRTVFSQPIKGTSKRGEDDQIDEKLKVQLQSSDKERAENLMIVDLVRNDLSRIARKGTVEVPELFMIQSFGTVHQMISTVRAEAEEVDPIEIIKACYPMGSMTGAPKISAMKTIEEFENYRRGIYSGAIGYIKPNGNFDFNVVIRTAILRGDKLYYSVGGAITSDSDPDDEWKETEIKSRALRNANSANQLQ